MYPYWIWVVTGVFFHKLHATLHLLYRYWSSTKYSWFRWYHHWYHWKWRLKKRQCLFDTKGFLFYIWVKLGHENSICFVQMVWLEVFFTSVFHNEKGIVDLSGIEVAVKYATENHRLASGAYPTIWGDGKFFEIKFAGSLVELAPRIKK